MLSIHKLAADFFDYVCSNDIEIYNEFSFQHELGLYLRKELPEYRVQFERNVGFFSDNTATVKKEIDIVIYTSDRSEMYALELKYPVNGQYPEQLYAFAKDIRFMEQIKERGFTKTACVVLVGSESFYRGKANPGIYRYFREEFKVYGEIGKPTGPLKDIEKLSLTGYYEIQWNDLPDERKYYCVEIM